MRTRFSGIRDELCSYSYKFAAESEFLAILKFLPKACLWVLQNKIIPSPADKNSHLGLNQPVQYSNLISPFPFKIISLSTTTRLKWSASLARLSNVIETSDDAALIEFWDVRDFYSD